MCNHKICAYFAHKKYNTGVGIIVYKNYIFPDNQTKASILLGKERYSRYAGLYNICAGTMEAKDKNCWIDTAIRELNEEFKIDLNYGLFYQKFCNKKDKKIRYFIHKTTPIFIGYFPEISTKSINKSLYKAIHNPFLPNYQKEMEHVSWFYLKNGKLEDVKNRNYPVSTFAEGTFYYFMNHFADYF